MSRKVWSIVVPVAVVAVVVAVITFVVVQDKGGADALTVNGQSVSQVTVNQELEALTGIQGNQKSTPGAVDSRLTAGWLTSRVRAAALEAMLHDAGVTIPAKELPSLRKEVDKQYPGLPTTAQDVIATFAVANQALTDKLGSADATTVLRRAARKLDVSVDPKYGRWDRARAQVCPPRPLRCPSVDTQAQSGSG